MQHEEFKKLEQSLDSLKEMMEIKIQQHSGHQSDVLDQLNSLRTDLDTLSKKVEPMFQAFSETATKKMVLGKYGIEIKNKSMWVIAVGGALGILWATLKFGFRYFKSG